MVKIFCFFMFMIFEAKAVDADKSRFLTTKLYEQNGFVTLKDKENDKVLLKSSKDSFIAPYERDKLDISVEFKSKKGGFDIIYKIKNKTKKAVLMPDLFIPGIKLRVSNSLDILSTNTKLYMQKRDINQIDKSRNYFNVGSMIYKKNDGSFIEEEFYYGADTFSPYAPVIVAKDERFSVGASLIYPFLEYGFKGKKERGEKGVLKNKLYVKMRIYKEKKSYTYAFLFAKDGYLKSFLAPKKSFVFVLSVRFSKAEDYIYTLYPYKLFLSKMYPVKKTTAKTLEPLTVVNFAFYGSVTKKNKRGWAWSLKKKDEKQEYILPLKEVCAALSEIMKKRGYKRVLFSAFSGVYDHKKAPWLFDELPFQILTNLPENMSEELDESMDIFKKAGQKIAFWWGIAGMTLVDKNANPLSNDIWQPYNERVFNIKNKVERDYALRQLDVAKKIGVSLLILDAYTRMEEKSAYIWLLMMKKYAPKIEFAFEMELDIMHRLGGIVLQPENKLFEDVDLKYNMLEKKALLAEYLNGKSEVFVWLQNRASGKDEREYVKRLISLGYTPIVSYPDSGLLNLNENNVTKRLLAHPEILTDIGDNTRR